MCVTNARHRKQRVTKIIGRNKRFWARDIKWTIAKPKDL